MKRTMEEIVENRRVHVLRSLDKGYSETAISDDYGQNIAHAGNALGLRTMGRAGYVFTC